jgi:hypothetical protein
VVDVSLPYVKEQAVGAIDGINVNFLTSTDYATGSLQVWRNGQLNRKTEPVEGWTELGFNAFSLFTPPLIGDVIQVGYRPL